MPDQPPATTWRAADQPLVSAFDLLLLDLDGVVYVGRHAVPGAAASVARARAAGVRCRYVTNNASRPPAEVARHLRELGIAAEDDEVVTAAQEGAERLAGRVPEGSQVLAIGGPGVGEALREVNLVPVNRYADGVAGVLQGYGPDVGWRDLAEASYAVTDGVPWVATNPDLTVPTPRGTAPGNGQLVAVVARTTGVSPEVTGKPGPGLFQSAVRRAGGERALVVGDRLDTDIAGAVAAQLPSLLVLTGVTDGRTLLGAAPEERPTYLGDDLDALWQAHPAVESRDGWWQCRDARAQVRAGQVDVRPGSEPLDTWRVVCAAVWTARDAGADGGSDGGTGGASDGGAGLDIATAAASLPDRSR